MDHSDTDNIIEFINVSKTFPGVKALRNVSFSIKKGEVHALVGENGAGKSTLIKILSGVHTPDNDSTIVINGEANQSLTPISAARKGIAVTYQDFALFPNLSVAENIAISGEIETGKKTVDWKTLKRIAAEAIKKVGVDIDVNAKLSSLSTAKQQLVAIARALVYDAKILILDEPTASLSSSEVEHLFKIIRDLKEKGIAILFISHKLDEIYAISDRITIMRDGQYMGTFNTNEIDTQKVISLMVGRNVEFERRKNYSNTNELLLEVKDLTKSGNYKGINFKLNKGEILGITGLVGAGRTEMCQSIFGVTQPDSGEIILEGKKIHVHSTSQAMEYGIAFVPESRQVQGLVLDKNVEDNITLLLLHKLLSKIKLINVKSRQGKAKELIKLLNVKPSYPDIQVSKLSGGNQQRVVLAKWIANNPKLLIIDEPTNGVDVGAKQEIHEILHNLAKQGMGIIMVSSELPEILAMSNRVLVMRKGRIVYEFDGDDVTQEQIMSKAIL